MRAVIRHVILVALAALAVSAPRLASAQNFTEWSSETRTALSFKVNAAALQKMLPAGWVSVPSSAPGTPGANLNLTMMERSIVLDPQGKPVRTGTSRYMVLGVPARNAQTGQTNTIIVGGLSPEGAGAYGVYLTATTAKLERTVSGEAEGYARVRESWEFSAASGERIELEVTYRRGPVTKAHVDSVVRSGIRPDFQRTYRIDQATDVLRSATTPDRVESLSFHATGPKLAALFDGTETLLSVSAIPFYVRDISIP
jgi:hypothetical protein